MQPTLNACVYIVDDDASVRDAMAWLLRSRRLMSESFASADEFERALQEKFPGPNTPVPTQAGCILLDVRMPGQSGLALFETLIGNGLAHTWPVIFLTGHADVPTAVDSVKRGAFDFCEKPTHGQADAPYNPCSKEFLHGLDTVRGATGTGTATADCLVDHVFGSRQGRVEAGGERRTRQQTIRQELNASLVDGCWHLNLSK